MASVSRLAGLGAEAADRPPARASDRALELLTEHSTDVLCELREGQIIYVSPNARRVSGLDPDELQGRRFVDFIHPDDVAALTEYWAPGWTGTIRAEVRIKNAADDWQWREVRGVRARDDDGGFRSVLVLRDVTERVELEAALRESERRFRELADAAPFVIYMTDEHFRTVFVNKAMLRFTGRTLEEQLAVPLGVNRHPDDATELREVSSAAIAQRERFTTEQRYRNAAGDHRWLITDAHPRVDDAGNHAGYIGYSVDITDRREAEEALRASEARAKALLSAIPDLMFRMTREGFYVDFKAERSEDLYVAPERIIGANIHELLPTDVATRVLEAIERTIDTGVTQTTEYRLPKRSGAWDYETRVTKSGANEAVLVCRDVTERKGAEAALRESEQRLRLIFHNAPLIVFAIDAAGVVTAADGKALEAVGLRAEDLVGFSAFDLYADAPEALDALRRALAGEAVTLTVDVRGVIWHAHLEPVGTGTAISGVIGVAVDLSARIRAEQALAASEERETVLRERQRIAQELHDSVAQYFFSIGMAANAALAEDGLTRDVLDERLGRIRQLSTEGGREIREAIHTLGEEPLPDINAAMQVLFESLRAEATDVRYAALPGTAAVPEHLRREILSVARECLFNVRKHANAVRVLVTLRSDARSLTLTIADDGTGDADRIDRVVHQGGGYGLRSMRARVRAIGGDVTWENNDGAGIRVTAVLPLPREESQ